MHEQISLRKLKQEFRKQGYLSSEGYFSSHCQILSNRFVCCKRQQCGDYSTASRRSVLGRGTLSTDNQTNDHSKNTKLIFRASTIRQGRLRVDSSPAQLAFFPVRASERAKERRSRETIVAGARFLKVPKTFRVTKAIRKTSTRLFYKAGLFISC